MGEGRSHIQSHIAGSGSRPSPCGCSQRALVRIKALLPAQSRTNPSAGAQGLGDQWLLQQEGAAGNQHNPKTEDQALWL